jgi:hypothetical protein
MALHIRMGNGRGSVAVLLFLPGTLPGTCAATQSGSEQHPEDLGSPIENTCHLMFSFAVFVLALLSQKFGALPMRTSEDKEHQGTLHL